MKNPFERKDALYILAGVAIILTPVVGVLGISVFGLVVQMINSFVLIAILYQLVALNKKIDEDESSKRAEGTLEKA